MPLDLRWPAGCVLLSLRAVELLVLLLGFLVRSHGESGPAVTSELMDRKNVFGLAPSSPHYGRSADRDVQEQSGKGCQE